jgi:ferredoxin
MLRRIRRILAFLTLFSLTFFLLGVFPVSLAPFQLLPALLAANGIAIVVILLVTVLFGRIYCSILCPLGIFQDIFIWLRHRWRKPSFSYTPEWRRLRYAMLVLVCLASIGGISFIPALLDPYSIYGRMVVHLLGPLWQHGTNLAVSFSEAHDVLPLERYDIVWQGGIALVVAALYFVLLAFLSWRYGRLYCNAICPVGTLLGTMSRFSWKRIYIDTAKCRNCGLCERRCKSSCIDVSTHQIDHSRCVDCFDCLQECPFQAIAIGLPQTEQHVPHTAAGEVVGPVLSRRALFLTAAAAAASLVSSVWHPALTVQAAREGEDLPVLPPGAVNRQRLAGQCTACHACVDSCPNQVLRPASLIDGSSLLQPVADYTRGACAVDCHRCGSVCPSQAIQPLSLEVKRRTRIGIARYDYHQCLIETDGVTCGNCAVHCPVHAITMAGPEGHKTPRVDESKCIGCGSCEYHCPASPRAMRVHGVPEQTIIS